MKSEATELAVNQLMHCMSCAQIRMKIHSHPHSYMVYFKCINGIFRTKHPIFREMFSGKFIKKIIFPQRSVSIQTSIKHKQYNKS